MQGGAGSRRFRLSEVVVFLPMWLLVGYSLGTATLLGPVRWAVRFARVNGWPELLEDAAVYLHIAALVVVSAAVAVLLSRLVARARRWDVRVGVPLLALLAASGAVWLWMQPDVMETALTPLAAEGSRFTFGPYPTEARMWTLKAEGYSGIISLLHPAVVPFEPRLLAEEKASAKRVGMRLISVPMLPWVSENRGALERIRKLAETGEGRYYVHCYLGRDRVRLVQRTIADLDPGVAQMPRPSPRALRDGMVFERGKLVGLEKGVYLAGLPTAEEFVYYLADADVRTVVSLLNPAVPGDRPWIAQEKRFLEVHDTTLVEIPLANEPVDPDAVRRAVARVRQLPRPVLVHGFLAPSTGRAPAAAAFVATYLASLPPWYERFLTRATPSPAQVLVLAPVLLLVAGLAGAWAGRLRIARGMATPYTRKVFHFIIFTLAGVLQLEGGLGAVMVYGVVVSLAVLYAVWRGEGFPMYEALARPTDRPHRTLFVLVPLVCTAVGGVLSNVLFPGYAAVGYLVAGWGDAVAEPVGTAWGRRPYHVPSLAGVPARRTVEGSTAVLLVGTFAAIAVLTGLGLPPGQAFGVGLACGVAGTVVEAFSNHGLDNLTVQVAAAAVAYLLLR